MLRRLALALLATAAACSGGGGSATKKAAPATMTLTSPAFAENGAIPRDFTCDGPNQSPPLNWSGVPKGAGSTALIMEDLDRSFLHWLAYDIPPGQTSADAGYTPTPTAVNDFGKLGYGGPCPPAGERHRYRFTVVAYQNRAQVSGVSAKSLEQQLLRSPLGRGELTGTYQRPGS